MDIKALDAESDVGRVRLELDGGFKPGRQFGRGKGGGQVRDNRKMVQQQALARGESGEKRRRDSGGGGSGYREIRLSRDSRGYDGNRRDSRGSIYGGGISHDDRQNNGRDKRQDKKKEDEDEGKGTRDPNDFSDIVVPSLSVEDDEERESGPAKKMRTDV